MIRFGLIGCGEHSERDMRCPLRDTRPRILVKLSCPQRVTPRPGRAQLFCEKYGFASAYSDMDEMLARREARRLHRGGSDRKNSGGWDSTAGSRMACSVEKPLGASTPEVTG